MSTLSEIINNYKFKTELHSHTSPVSACGRVTAADLAKQYIGTGCNALVITNHLNPLWTSGSAAQRAKEYLLDYTLAKKAAKGSSLEVILGVEIRFCENDNDYLVYGVDEFEIEKMIYYIDKGIAEFYKNIKNDRNLILQAHPFRKNMVHAPIGCIDGIETFNCHPGQNSAIAYAANYAKKHNFYISGGSDFHQSPHLAACLMCSKQQPKNSFDIAKILKSRDFLFDISGHIVYPFG